MKRNDLACGLVSIVLLLSCATAPFGAEGADDPIVGRWRGTGAGASMVVDIRNNNTLRDNWGEKSAWKKVGDSQYHLFFNPKDSEQGMVFTLTPEDQLVSEYHIIFKRKSTTPRRTNKPSFEALAGEWVFIYVRNSVYPMAPPFDRTNFMKDGDVISTSTIVSLGINGKYSLSGDKLKFSKMGPESTASRVTVSMEDDDKTLILIPEGQPPMSPDWVYVRPDKLRSDDDLRGIWVRDLEMGNMKMEIELFADGHLEKTVIEANSKSMPMPKMDPKAQVYYRLWSSKLGKMITIVDIDNTIGLIAESFQYEINDGALVLTPLSSEEKTDLKLDEREQIIYQSKKDKDATPVARILEPTKTPESK